MGCSIHPSNPYLRNKDDCHINVEICDSVISVKYLQKYTYKGRDRAILESGEDIDDFKQYIEARYISPQNLFIYSEFLKHYEWNQRTDTVISQQRA